MYPIFLLQYPLYLTVCSKCHLDLTIQVRVHALIHFGGPPFSVSPNVTFLLQKAYNNEQYYMGW